jgi:hypothetical protein
MQPGAPEQTGRSSKLDLLLKTGFVCGLATLALGFGTKEYLQWKVMQRIDTGDVLDNPNSQTLLPGVGAAHSEAPLWLLLHTDDTGVTVEDLEAGSTKAMEGLVLPGLGDVALFGGLLGLRHARRPDSEE